MRTSVILSALAAVAAAQDSCWTAFDGTGATEYVGGSQISYGGFNFQQDNNGNWDQVSACSGDAPSTADCWSAYDASGNTPYSIGSQISYQGYNFLLDNTGNWQQDGVCAGTASTTADSSDNSGPAPAPQADNSGDSQPTQPAVQTGCASNDYGCISQSDFQNTGSAESYVSGLSFDDGCLALNNHARNLYNPGSGNFVYDSGLAALAVVSATVAANVNYFEAHSYSGSAYSWGQNLFVGEYDCASAYPGWITDEAASIGGHFANAAALGIPYVAVGCGAATSNDGSQTAVVCNYGLITPADLSGLPSISQLMAAAQNSEIIVNGVVSAWSPQ